MKTNLQWPSPLQRIPLALIVINKDKKRLSGIFFLYKILFQYSKQYFESPFGMNDMGLKRWDDNAFAFGKQVRFSGNNNFSETINYFCEDIKGSFSFRQFCGKVKMHEVSTAAEIC
jgi:hypothetical protein